MDVDDLVLFKTQCRFLTTESHIFVIIFNHSPDVDHKIDLVDHVLCSNRRIFHIKIHNKIDDRKVE